MFVASYTCVLMMVHEFYIKVKIPNKNVIHYLKKMVVQKL